MANEGVILIVDDMPSDVRPLSDFLTGKGFDVRSASSGRAAIQAAVEGSKLRFRAILMTALSFVFGVLPVIVFLGSVFGILYHVGLLPWLVRVLAAALSRGMKLSGAESLAAVANIVVGMVESTLIVKPYVMAMTRSELFTTMSLGMATVAGSVLVAYVQFLGGGDFAGHLITASLMSAPAGVLIAKIMVPETQTPATSGNTVSSRSSSPVTEFTSALP